MRYLYTVILSILVMCISSCSTPKYVTYFQDTWDGDSSMIAVDLDIRLQKGDQFTLVVHNREPQLSQMFNLPIRSQMVGGENLPTNLLMSLYTVDDNGDIDIPNVGILHVLGMTRNQVVDYVKNKIMAMQLLNDPVITVEFNNMYINVLGEVNRPGRYALTKDHTSIFDAIGMAGDMTIYGERRHVRVMRQEGDVRKVYQLDFTKMHQVASSPAYYMQQGDVIYVDPNKYRKRQTTVNGNNVRSTSTYLTLVTILMSTAILLFK